MMLFFESSHQAMTFLSTVTAGFLLVFLLELPVKRGGLRLTADLLAVFFSSVMLLVYLLFCQTGILRSYYLLGLVVGIFLHVKGIGRIIKRRSK